MVRLTIGAAMLPEEIQQRHASYVLGLQNDDGGWAGREGESDPYYSSFALRSLAILGLLDGKVAEDSARFLTTQLDKHHGIVDLLSIVYSSKLIEVSCGLDPFQNHSPNWPSKLNAMLETLRRDDGGYSKTLEGGAGSTYQTFLVLLCQETIESKIENAADTLKFLLSQRQSDGGFLEIRVGKRSGTNPTAAAIGAMRVLNGLTEEVSEEAIDFLLDLQTDEGGFQANTRIPMPDLLSTFTACVTLADLESLHEIDSGAALRYAISMQSTGGGFGGFEYDTGQDVEYTFYGLGTLALLSTI
jgi:geranylgeranyl transferase type-2 subunit beta